MTSDRRQYKYAMRKWELLSEEQRFSATEELGVTAIMFSTYAMGSDETAKQIERDHFEIEAHNLADSIVAQKGLARVIRGINREEFYHDVMADESVASLILIGHGDFSSIYCDDETKIDWRDVSQASQHLKTGYVEQRFCGNYLRDLSVPFGQFAVTDPSNVIAPAGEYFAPELQAGDESLLRRVTKQRQLTYGHIKQFFPADPARKAEIEQARQAGCS